MHEQPMSFWKATALFWSNYFNFSGRSGRKEYRVPFFTQLARRLHDTGRSGKWALLFYLVPIILSWISMIINNFGNQ